MGLKTGERFGSDFFLGIFCVSRIEGLRFGSIAVLCAFIGNPRMSIGATIQKRSIRAPVSLTMKFKVLMRNPVHLALPRILAVVLSVAGLLRISEANAEESPRFDWREQNAYAQGVQAYIYAFPWSYMAEARWTRSEPVDHQANRFDHVRKLEDASHLTGGAPNNDTLYSRAWVYLKDEPVILTVPEISDRYHSVELADFMDDNFAYVGTRATGDSAGSYGIVGPGWKGKLPAGVTALPPSSTPWAFVLVRTYVKGVSDLPAAYAIQDKYKLTPLSQWGKAKEICS